MPVKKRRKKKSKRQIPSSLEYLSKQFHLISTSAGFLARPSLLATKGYGEFYSGMLLPRMKPLLTSWGKDEFGRWLTPTITQPLSFMLATGTGLCALVKFSTTVYTVTHKKH